MILLALGVVSLFIGPLFVARYIQTKTIDLLSKTSVTLVLILIIWHMIPMAQKEGWSLIVLPFIAGIAVPWIIEKFLHNAIHTSHEITFSVALFGLILHSAIDGAGLTEIAVEQSEWLLPIGVISHRLIMGIAIWTLIKQHFSSGRGVMVLCLMAVATISGYMAASSLEAMHDQVFFASFEALAAGALGHMLLHKPHKH